LGGIGIGLTRTRDGKGEMERMEWKRLGIRDKSTETEETRENSMVFRETRRIPKNLARI
jgi:hypothetical protein